MQPKCIFSIHENCLSYPSNLIRRDLSFWGGLFQSCFPSPFVIYDHLLPHYSLKSFKPRALNFEGFVCIDLFEVGGLFCIIRNVL
jgi:hypothetical protein